MTDYNELIEVIEITDDLKALVSINFDKTQVFLDVSYMEGKFTIQRVFANNYLGLEELEKAKKQFNSVANVKEYLNL